MRSTDLPEPVCELGYPQEQLKTIMSRFLYEDFCRWMRGQTGGICDGRRYNFATKEYEETRCGPHGTVVYVGDVETFLRGGPNLD